MQKVQQQVLRDLLGSMPDRECKKPLAAGKSTLPPSAGASAGIGTGGGRHRLPLVSCTTAHAQQRQ